MNTCYIIGAGESDIVKIKKCDGDFVICADGGLKAAQKSGIIPDLIVGDFDSFGSVPSGANVIVHPAEKDETDTHLAINCGLERGFKRFIMYGMLGGRLDHTFANLLLLSYLCENGASGTLIGCGHKVTAVKNSRIDFDEAESGMISVFSLTPESVVTISGLKYEVDNFTLKSSYPMGVSNEFLGKKSSVTAHDGTLLIIWEDKN